MSPVAPFTAKGLRLLIVTVLESLARFHGHCQGQAPRRKLSPMTEAKVQRELNTYPLAWLERTPQRMASHQRCASSWPWC
jgi:hypothetical protein